MTDQPQPLTEQQLDDAAAAHFAYRRSHDHPRAFACCSAHAAADTVPALVADNRRLRARVTELEAERVELNAMIRSSNEAAATARARVNELESSAAEPKPSTAPGICRCGHRQAAHDNGEPGCSACPSTGNWNHSYTPSTHPARPVVAAASEDTR